MKKNTLTVLLLATLLLSACSGAAPATPPAAPVENVPAEQPAASPPAATQSTAQMQSTTLNADCENAVSVAMQLLLGTFKLEGTTNAVTREQAAALTPLWTNFKSLSESMRPAQGEPGQQGQPNGTPQPVDSGLQSQLDETLKQIQSVLTAEQIQAIVDMKITQETAQTIMEEKGITMDDRRQGEQGGGQPPAGGGDMPQETAPDGGGQMGTPPDRAKPGDMGGFLPTKLIDALLELLVQKAAS